MKSIVCSYYIDRVYIVFYIHEKSGHLCNVCCMLRV
jgi:hypothetical protein